MMAVYDPKDMSSRPRMLTRRELVAGAGVAAALVGAQALARPRSALASGFLDAVRSMMGDTDPADGTSAATDAEPATLDSAATDAAAVPDTATRPSMISGITSVEEPAASVPAYTVASDLSDVSVSPNLYLDEETASRLPQYMFACNLNQGYSEFHTLYEMNRYDQVPNFVTVDAMTHTYHLFFSHLLKNCEQSSLYDALLQMSSAAVSVASSQLDSLAGTTWEEAANMCLATFAVGQSLLDSNTEIPASVFDKVASEIALIYGGAGIAASAVVTGAQIDYSQFILRGYYTETDVLQAYFRAMMWYGLVNFDSTSELLKQCATLITLVIGSPDVLAQWEKVYQVTAFFAGQSDDYGYYEYAPLIEQVFGADATAESIAADADGWQTFSATLDQLPAPQIGGLALIGEGQDDNDNSSVTGFRVMGQRYSLDASIMQYLIYNAVTENPAHELRTLPDVLDIPAAMGSDTAYSLLDSAGATQFGSYPEHMQELREKISAAGDDVWQASLSSAWLSMIKPLTVAKGEGYPSFMQSDQWARKDLQSYSGSYAELKHDTVLYAKQAIAEMGGDQIYDYDDRGYVEPEPVVFGRMAALVDSTVNGLTQFGMLSDQDASDLAILKDLATQLQTIATKELRNETPTDDEFELIRSFGGQIEHFWESAYAEYDEGMGISELEYPAAIITDIATDPINGNVLEIGTGACATLYVIVPVDGVLKLTVGSAYSFYEFSYPLSERLDDVTWRQMLGLYQEGDTGKNEDLSVPMWTWDYSIG